jgi:hypothetical protein
MSDEKQHDRYRVVDSRDGLRSGVIDTHGSQDTELHERLSPEEMCNRLNADENAATAERVDVGNVNDRLDRLRGDIGRIVAVFIDDLKKHFLSLESSKQIVEHPDGADSQTKKLGTLRDARFGPDPIPGAESPLFRCLTVIVQAAKPGDVVFVEAQRDLTDDEMMRMKEMCESLSLGVKIVVLPKHIKVAGKVAGAPARDDPHTLVARYFDALDKAREVKDRAGTMGLESGHMRTLNEAEAALRESVGLKITNR